MVVAALSLFAGQPALSQGCGDVDVDGTIMVSDLTALFNYIHFDSPVPPDSTYADMDDRHGITISDLAILSDLMFNNGGPLDCSIDSVYYYECSKSDTVFVPHKTYISESVDTVMLPLVASWESSTRQAYLPFDVLGSGSNGVFQFDDFTGDYHMFGDTALIVTGTPVGRDTIGYFEYSRVSSGIGHIVLDQVDRSPFRRFAIEKGDYNLSRPATLYAYPPGDINCDGALNVADLTHMVAYQFKEGPPPCNPYDRPAP